MTIFRVALQGLDGWDNEWVNVLHYETTALGILLNAGALADLLDDQLEAAFPSIAAVGITMNLLSIRNLGDSTDGVDAPLTIAGARSGSALSPQLAGQVVIRTAKFGRSYTGRFNVPGPVETDQDIGVPNAAYVEDLLEYADAIATANIAAVPYAQIGVYSRKLDLFTPYTGFTIAEHWGDLDSRKQY